MTRLNGALAFRELQERLRGAHGLAEAEFDEGEFSRLSEAMAAMGSTFAPGPADLAGLLRHALRYWGARTHTDPTLSLPGPLASGFTQALLDRHGLIGLRSSGELVIRAAPWRPNWVADAPPFGIDHDAAAAFPRTRDQAVSGEPFFTAALGYPDYRSAAQRAAVRAVVDAPAGSSLVIVLPTGEGKSACFHTAARVGWNDRGLARGTVLVVSPTVALALDHEVNARGLGFAAPMLAYQAGDPGNQGIMERLEDGTQQIVFASPEAALGPMRVGLIKAAKAGLISALVVDEAHLVDAWGGVFRPDFQLLSGLFREMVDLSPQPKPRTLLLTATLTSTALSVLEALFGSFAGPLALSAAPTVRPEHSYWTTGFVEEAQQDLLVDEAVAMLPRPLILYATSRADVARHFRRLAEAGYRRIGLMTGESSVAERSELLDRWSRGRCDVVVATSAFGLGVNHGSVRSIVHACVPEGIDRFYQEVGRSGRDGRAAISVLIPTRENLREGRGLAKQKLITPEKGHQRWEQMFVRGSFKGGEGGNQVELQFDIAPGVDPDRIDMLNEQNTKWNLRVLSMMAIAGLVTIRTAPRRVRVDGQEKAVLSVDIEDMEHRDFDAFESAVRPYRYRVAKSAAESMKLMTDYVQGSLCLGDAVARQYAIPASAAGRPSVTVRGSCPGCGRCRPGSFEPPQSYSPKHPWEPRVLSEEQARLLGPGGRMVVLYSPPFIPDGRDESARRRECLRRLLVGSYRSVRLDPALDHLSGELQEICGNWPLFFAPDPVAGGRLPPGPTVIVRASKSLASDLDQADQPLIVFATSVADLYPGTVRRVEDVEDYLLQ